MKLTLSSPIAYRPTTLSLNELIAKAEKASPGYDAAILYSLSLSDMLKIERIEGGEREGYTEEERKAIEQGEIIKPKADETFLIPSGNYIFDQYPSFFTEEDLPRLLLPYATKNRQIYIRIFHESVLETVMQIFVA